MTAAAGTLSAEASALGGVPPEMIAPLANMLEAAVTAGLPPAGDGTPPSGQREAGDDAGRAEDHGGAPGPDGADLPAPVHADAGPRARRVHRPAVRAGRRGRPARLASRPHRGDRLRPGAVRPDSHPP